MKDFKDIVRTNGQIISFKGEDMKYLEIVNFPDSRFSYGASEKGWVVYRNSNTYFIKNKEDNYIVFFSILELPCDLIISNIISRIKQLTDEKVSIFDFFPIKSITKTAINMESSYWSILCLDLLLEAELYDFDFSDYLFSKKESKWIPQPLKHKLLKYISRVRNNEWKNSDLNRLYGSDN